MYKKMLSVILASIVITLSGCSVNENTSTAQTTSVVSQASAESASDSTSAFPLTISHAYGTTTVTSQPTRIVTVGWSNESPVLALGIVPVGASAANYGAVGENGLLPWVTDAYAQLGESNPVVFYDTDGLDFEAISDAQPDIILAPYSGLTQEDYDTLSQIAPTIPYKEKAWATSWREQMSEVAQALGMQSKGDAIVEECEQILADTIAAYPDLTGKNAALCWINAADMSSFYVYTPTDPRGSYLEDLGFHFPESLAALDDGNSFTITVSSEYIDVLNDLDIIITYGDEETLTALQNDPLFSQVPAVQKGNVVLLDSTSELAAACNPSVLSIQSGMSNEYMAYIDATYNK